MKGLEFHQMVLASVNSDLTPLRQRGAPADTAAEHRVEEEERSPLYLAAPLCHHWHQEERECAGLRHAEPMHLPRGRGGVGHGKDSRASVNARVPRLSIAYSCAAKIE